MAVLTTSSSLTSRRIHKVMRKQHLIQRANVINLTSKSTVNQYFALNHSCLNIKLLNSEMAIKCCVEIFWLVGELLQFSSPSAEPWSVIVLNWHRIRRNIP